MSQDKLASLVRALRRVPRKMLGLLLDIAIRLCGEEGELFFHSLKRFVAEWRSPIAELSEAPKIMVIKRNFNPEKFLGIGWSVVEYDTDTRSKALKGLNPNKVKLVTTLQDGESRIAGEERLRRLKAGNYVRLDADIFQTFWENKQLIPESWKEKVDGNTRYIFFDGTVLRDEVGRHCVLSLYWYGGAWKWEVTWLVYAWNSSRPSAVLAQEEQG